jgi:ATP-binding cassette subfamily C (CFTR/MRP) protein 1
MCVQRWLQVVSDVLIAVITIGAIVLATRTTFMTSGAQVGIMLNLLMMSQSTFFRLIETWTALEISLGAVSRLRNSDSRDNQDHDSSRRLLRPPTTWPSKGELVLRDVQVSYT